MTAEIAIMNKTALAFAADSAVTYRGREGSVKIFNSANKIFRLSRYHPVGIMVYGNAEFMKVPWETIIKIYKESIGSKKFDTLEKYSKDFISFIGNNELFFPKQEQEIQFILSLCRNLAIVMNAASKIIDDEVKKQLDKNGEIPQTLPQQLLLDFLLDRHCHLKKESGPNLIDGKKYLNGLVDKYHDKINEYISSIYGNYLTSDNITRKLFSYCIDLYCKEINNEFSSGVVIGGYGEKDIFPVVHSFECEGVIKKKMKYRERSLDKISNRDNASIQPFAQRDVIDIFIQGTDEKYATFIIENIYSLMEIYHHEILNSLKGVKREIKDRILSINKDFKDNKMNELQTKSKKYLHINFIQPIIEVVSFLPKNELAEMAESLINIMSFRKRISANSDETVGGPIDVAVISKGDGFAWIKHKHYFDPHLNPTLMANFYNLSMIEEKENGDKNKK